MCILCNRRDQRSRGAGLTCTKRPHSLSETSLIDPRDHRWGYRHARSPRSLAHDDCPVPPPSPPVNAFASSPGPRPQTAPGGGGEAHSAAPQTPVTWQTPLLPPTPRTLLFASPSAARAAGATHTTPRGGLPSAAYIEEEKARLATAARARERARAIAEARIAEARIAAYEARIITPSLLTPNRRRAAAAAAGVAGGGGGNGGVPLPTRLPHALSPRPGTAGARVAGPTSRPNPPRRASPRNASK
jgi:hypothetical protein